MLYKEEGKKEKKKRKQQGLYFWRLKAAAAAATAALEMVEAYSVLGGSNSQVGLLDVHLPASETICD